MFSTRVSRLSGLALLIGSVLVTVFIVLLLLLTFQGTASTYTGPFWRPVLLMVVVGLLLLAGGLPGLYTQRVRRQGWVGLVGTVLTVVAMLLFAAFFAVYALVIPSLDTQSQLLLTGYSDMNLNAGRIPPLVMLAQVAALSWCIGTFLLDRALLRADMPHHWIGNLLLAATPAGFLIFLFPLVTLSQPLSWSLVGDFVWVASMILIPLGLLAFCFGLAMCGYALLSRRGTQATPSQSIVTKA